ncbi:hypothetical protein LSTR_LSTR000530 [Laodelphax striatellus]|uniref:Uncharacterized protein n=1 Tax=Laodelphax striatellus TaxID=195883 RepID=A0A482WZ09_LAOST|nr:hypothetical protein LSTR_LSTR000530 [Laodelphax striatellus]
MATDKKRRALRNGRGAKQPKGLSTIHPGYHDPNWTYVPPYGGPFLLTLPPPRRKKHTQHNSSSLCHRCHKPLSSPCHEVCQMIYQGTLTNQVTATPFRKAPWHSNLHMLKF